MKTHLSFRECISTFEQTIIVNGVSSGWFTRVEKIPARQCKLYNTEFGDALGKSINTPIPIVVDYYGYLKHSKGFDEKCLANKNKRMVEASVVHFASVRIEDIEALDKTGLMLTNFVKMKNRILTLKGFKHRKPQEDF